MTTCRRRLTLFLRALVLATIATGKPGTLGADPMTPAAMPTGDAMAQLETALEAYVGDRTENGRFVYFNPVRGEFERYGAIVGPIRIIALPDGRYVLCARVQTADGRNVEIDFLALVDARGSRVIQTLVDQHGAVLRLIRSRDPDLH